MRPVLEDPADCPHEGPRQAVAEHEGCVYVVCLRCGEMETAGRSLAQQQLDRLSRAIQRAYGAAFLTELVAKKERELEEALRPPAVVTAGPSLEEQREWDAMTPEQRKNWLEVEAGGQA
jgi:hypothetical protein